eukprot:g1215.t1
MGTAIRPELLGLPNSTYGNVASQQYSGFVAENACKWTAIQAKRGVFNFSSCDAVVEFARQSNASFRGHNLLWTAYNPPWLALLNATEKREALIEHVTAVASRYRDTAFAFDAVNEPVCDSVIGEPSPCGHGSGSSVLKTTGSDRQPNPWLPDVPDFVELAFATARAAAPNMKLFLNDYMGESESGILAGKSDRIFDYVKSLLAKNISIDGVGLQLHSAYNVWHWPYGTIDGIQKNIERIAALGLEVHITELDLGCDLPTLPCLLPYNDDARQHQARTYASILDACLAVKRCTAFLTWGFSDSVTWRSSPQQQHALPFDEEFRPKPAVASMVASLAAAKGEPEL